MCTLQCHLHSPAACHKGAASYGLHLALLRPGRLSITGSSELFTGTQPLWSAVAILQAENAILQAEKGLYGRF